MGQFDEPRAISRASVVEMGTDNFLGTGVERDDAPRHTMSVDKARAIAVPIWTSDVSGGEEGGAGD